MHSLLIKNGKSVVSVTRKSVALEKQISTLQKKRMQIFNSNLKYVKKHIKDFSFITIHKGKTKRKIPATIKNLTKIAKDFKKHWIHPMHPCGGMLPTCVNTPPPGCYYLMHLEMIYPNGSSDITCIYVCA